MGYLGLEDMKATQTSASNRVSSGGDVGKYDAIIVGGGTAGLVAASRLSETPFEHKRILVIEAGHDHRGDPVLDVPGLIGAAWGKDEYDWSFWTEPQKHLGGRQLPQPRGKVLGGSSALNIALMAYPSPKDFDIWNKIGNPGWNAATMAPYYRKFQKFNTASQATQELLKLNTYVNEENYGTDGPLSVSFPDAYGPCNTAFEEAFASAGFDGEKSDPALGCRQGAFTCPNSISAKSHKRSYSASAYATEELDKRPNIHILTGVFVTKLLFHDKDSTDLLKAKGVQVQDDTGASMEIEAGEVILAAGTFQTPIVLESSGIGSRTRLEKHRIPVVLDLPGVGENLQDHLQASVAFEVNDGVSTRDDARDAAVVEAAMQQYNETGSGPFSGFPVSLAFTPPVDGKGKMALDDLQELFEPKLHQAGTNLGGQAQLTELAKVTMDPTESACYYMFMAGQQAVDPVNKTTMAEVYAPHPTKNFVTFVCGLNRPFSRGSVHLSGTNPQRPLIDPNYLSHPLDLELLARGLQYVDILVQQDGMKKILKPNGTYIPAVGFDLSNIDTAKQMVKDRLWTTYHPCGTCAMLPRILGGVVDSRLLVHGTSNVRIIDASVFPTIPMGNIQTTVYAVAERACDMIKEDWKEVLN